MTTLTISPASSPVHLDTIRVLFREYEAAIGIDLCFQGFAAELESLPGDYVPPRGRLYLAAQDSEPTGCIAMRPLDGTICEMKRLYARPSARGTGLGRRLAELLIADARAEGYTAMRLDTLPSMVQAIALYRSLGFCEIPPYRHNPIGGALYFELALSM